jgi:hypothetical protein
MLTKYLPGLKEAQGNINRFGKAYLGLWRFNKATYVWWSFKWLTYV